MAAPDLDEFRRLSNPRKAPCKIGVALAGLNGDASTLRAALDADKGEITAGAIVAWLARRGHKATNPAVVSHRNGTCNCVRDA